MNTASIKGGPTKAGVPWAVLYALRSSGLLSDEQLDHLQQYVNALDPLAFEALVLEKGWLTAYQWKRIMEGQGRDLILGRYRILDELGSGGFGTVYKAVHTIMDRVAAVKVLAPKWAALVEGRDLFLREVLAITHLQHPNIVLAYEANQTDDTLWFAMEYVNGPNLDKEVAEKGPLPVPFVCNMMYQVGQALQFAHEQGMVHRDVKPANLLLPRLDSVEAPPQGSPVLVKIVDFGLARLFPRGSLQLGTLCKDGNYVGTPEFMSPEQARNSHEVDIRSDLYSLGCTFYYALTGQKPFQGSTEMELFTQHLENEPQPIRELCPEVPQDIVDLVKRLMAKKPENRFATPADLVAALAFSVANPFWGRSWCPPPPSPPATSTPAPVNETKEPSREQPPSDEVASASPVPAGAQERVVALWSEWTAVVTSMARGTILDWKEDEYRSLHEALLVALRVAAGSSPLFARLQSCAEPWITLRSLAGLDRQTLLGLFNTCRQLKAELAPARSPLLGAWLLFVLFLLGAALVGVFAFSQHLLPFPGL